MKLLNFVGENWTAPLEISMDHRQSDFQKSSDLWSWVGAVYLHESTSIWLMSLAYSQKFMQVFMFHAALLRSIFPCGCISQCPLFHGFLFQFLLFSISQSFILFSWLLEHLNKDGQNLCHWCKSHHKSSSVNITPKHDPYSYTDKNLHHLHGC